MVDRAGGRHGEGVEKDLPAVEVAQIMSGDKVKTGRVGISSNCENGSEGQRA